MRLATFAQTRQDQQASDLRFNKRLIGASILGFVLTMTLGLLLPVADRWLAAIAAATVLLSLFTISSLRNARVLKETSARCWSCDVALLYEPDTALSTGACPHCGKAAFPPDQENAAA
jgi:predicted RNA-binding Zn-ribbon protein involved in translation (DUF1610 family)